MIGPTTPALAGGEPGPTCPAASRVDIPADGPASAASAVRVEAGFYAQTGLYWPPTKAILCQEPLNTHHPLFRISTGGCVAGTVGLLVPNDIGLPDGSPLYGTFLPPGWYYLGTGAPPSWSNVCWSIAKPKP